MTVFSFYLFDRSATCLLYHQWNRPRQSDSPLDDQNNMFGLLFALRNFSTKLSPTTSAPSVPTHFLTDVYALHYYETPTGLRFVLTTSRAFLEPDLTHHLFHIYANIFVPHLVHNPLYLPGSPIDSPVLLSVLDHYIRTLPCF